MTKCDALDPETMAQRAEALRIVARKKPLIISAVSGAGMKDALFALARELGRADEKDREAEAAKAPKQQWSPA